MEFWTSSLADWKDNKRWSWPQQLPNFALCTVPYFMGNTLAAQLQTLLSVEHRGVNLLGNQSPAPTTCLGTEVCVQPSTPPDLPGSGSQVCPGTSAWPGRLLWAAPWAAVQSTHRGSLCQLLTLKHRNDNLVWKCKWLHWPALGVKPYLARCPAFKGIKRRLRFSLKKWPELSFPLENSHIQYFVLNFDSKRKRVTQKF